MPASPAEFLFDPAVLPQSVKERLGDDLELRPLAISDYARGHFDLLSVLTAAPQLTREEYASQFEALRACPGTYFTAVIVHKPTDKLVACGTVFIERKFVRGGGIVAHIEDIAVSKTMQGRKLGLLIIKTLEEIARSQACYKVILDCAQHNIAFYDKCGFHHKEFQCVMYLENQPTTSTPAVQSRL